MLYTKFYCPNSASSGTVCRRVLGNSSFPGLARRASIHIRYRPGGSGGSNWTGKEPPDSPVLLPHQILNSFDPLGSTLRERYSFFAFKRRTTTSSLEIVTPCLTPLVVV